MKSIILDPITTSERRFKALASSFLKNVFGDFLRCCSKDPDIYGVYRLRPDKGREVKYAMTVKTKEMFAQLGLFLTDLDRISNDFILPQTNEEMVALAENFARAKTTGKPMNLYTPLCPDWSMDNTGRYDFRSLGGSVSFIAKKFFRYAPKLLRILTEHKIPYQGLLIFADWGMETELDEKNTYGKKLTQENIRMCFTSSLAATDEHLLGLQNSSDSGTLFVPFKVVSMIKFFEDSGLDLVALDERFRRYFSEDRDGAKLLNELVTSSAQINRERMGHDDRQNRQMCLETLIDYATLGQALNSYGLIIACESQISSKAYNRPRTTHDKIPMIFVKGKSGDVGVNML